MRINTTDDCTPGPIRDSNPFCSANIDVTNFLNLNSYVKHDDFCLAYIFTYRDFNGGTLGLAWVAEPGGSGGVCEKHRMMQEGSQNVRKSLNTGIVTLLNYGSYVSCRFALSFDTGCDVNTLYSGVACLCVCVRAFFSMNHVIKQSDRQTHRHR